MLKFNITEQFTFTTCKLCNTTISIYHTPKTTYFYALHYNNYYNDYNNICILYNFLVCSDELWKITDLEIYKTKLNDLYSNSEELTKIIKQEIIKEL